MANSEVAIANLLYRYAEYVDSGDFEGAAALFLHARVLSRDGELDHAGVLALWQGRVTLYDDGTPRTKHVITNPIIEVDEAAGTGTCRSYYTVLQQVGDCALHPIICGRYHDEFERVDGVWRFRFRDYSLTDLIGNLSKHLTPDQRGRA